MRRALALILLSGCASKPYVPMPVDGAVYERTIKWVVTADARGVCERIYGKPLTGTLVACVHPSALDTTRECVIYASRPRDETDRQTIYVLGHEALHCFIGEFHR